jgi:hypothetical protein
MKPTRFAFSPAGLVAILFAVLLAVPADAQPGRPAAGGQVDSTFLDAEGWVYRLRGFSVTARALRFHETEAPVSKGALGEALREGGVVAVRRGVGLSGDLALGGFSGGEVELVVDGERMPASCPNRMDPPGARVNPLEVDAVRVDRSAVGLHAGLGGGVAFRRAAPAEAWRLRATVEQTGTTATDAALAVERAGHRVSARVLDGRSYTDGAGVGFGARYGYRTSDVSYDLVEASAHGRAGGVGYALSVARTKDLPFPYLMMDERENLLWAASAELGGHRFYANYTAHRMDNGLRMSADAMAMRTDTRQWTAGLTGPEYEVYLRRWDAWNEMGTPHAGPKHAGHGPAGHVMRQHLLPELWAASGAVVRTAEHGRFAFAGRVGLTRVAAGEADRLDFFDGLYPDAPSVRWFGPFAVSATYRRIVGGWGVAGASAEVASVAPAAERLYLALRRMGERPSWSGNPVLAQAVKGDLRAGLDAGPLRADAALAYVRGHVTPVAALAQDGTRFVTYANVDALIASTSAQAEWPALALRAAYTWGQRLDLGQPLPEVAPLAGTVTLRTPWADGLSAALSVEAAAGQPRIAPYVGERPAEGWARLDARVAYARGAATVALEATNLTGALYADHLAYRRDPFATGEPVYEPGRTLRLSLRLTP